MSVRAGTDNFQFAVIAERDPYRADGSKMSASERVVFVQPALARGQKEDASVDGPRESNLYVAERRIDGTFLTVVVQVDVGVSTFKQASTSKFLPKF